MYSSLVLVQNFWRATSRGQVGAGETGVSKKGDTEQRMQPNRRKNNSFPTLNLCCAMAAGAGFYVAPSIHLAQV